MAELITVDVEVLIITEPDGEGFHAWSPQLPGLHVGGETMEEATQNAQDGARLYLESLLRHPEDWAARPSPRGRS